ncbi:MAG TPA: zinc metallopeptidase [Coriobacteriia bacterium]|nr:zinc metallopeptidase [Coriobacteriia bacterium]
MFLGAYGLPLFILATVLGLATQAFVKSSYRKNSQQMLPMGLTGAEVARRVLDSEGLSRVSIEVTPGTLSDHYDPRTDVLRLSQDVYHGAHVAAAGVAAHEAGHAVQHARGFAPAKARMALVPVANLGSKAGPILIMLGLVFATAGQFSDLLLNLGIGLFAAAVLFQLVTLPVELDASRRALAALTTTGSIVPGQEAGARQVLTAAALTYVAAALVSVLYLLRLWGLSRNN